MYDHTVDSRCKSGTVKKDYYTPEFAVPSTEYFTLLYPQQPGESFGMNVAGGMDCHCGDLPVFVSALKPNSVAARSGKIQVRKLLLW